MPDDCGRYKVDVKYAGKDVPQAPFAVQAYAIGNVILRFLLHKSFLYVNFALQADKCKITEGIQRNLHSGEEYCITVNTENAGNGAVTCRIRSTSGRYAFHSIFPRVVC